MKVQISAVGKCVRAFFMRVCASYTNEAHAHKWLPGGCKGAAVENLGTSRQVRLMLGSPHTIEKHVIEQAGGSYFSEQTQQIGTIVDEGKGPFSSPQLRKARGTLFIATAKKSEAAKVGQKGTGKATLGKRKENLQTLQHSGLVPPLLLSHNQVGYAQVH